MARRVAVNPSAGTASAWFGGTRHGHEPLAKYRSTLLEQAGTYASLSASQRSRLSQQQRRVDACNVAAERGVTATCVAMSPGLLKIIANLMAEGDEVCKKLFREYTLGVKQTPAQLVWCVERMLELGRDACEEEVVAFADMLTYDYHAFAVDADGAVDYYEEGDCLGAPSACAALLHDCFAALLSPPHVKRMGRDPASRGRDDFGEILERENNETSSS